MIDHEFVEHWIPIEQSARHSKSQLHAIINDLENGTLKGIQRDGRWYLPRPLAEVHTFDPQRMHLGVLKVRAARLGNYLTHGHADVLIPIEYGEVVHQAISTLMADAEHPIDQLTTVTIGDQSFILDSSLRLDVGAALVAFTADFELKDLLQQYQPEAR